MKRYSDKEIIKLCHDVQIGTGGMDYADALNKIAEELTLRGEQETPQEAWKRGFEEGVGESIAEADKSGSLNAKTKLAVFLIEPTPYVAPPLPYQEEKESR